MGPATAGATATRTCPADRRGSPLGQRCPGRSGRNQCPPVACPPAALSAHWKPRVPPPSRSPVRWRITRRQERGAEPGGVSRRGVSAKSRQKIVRFGMEWDCKWRADRTGAAAGFGTAARIAALDPRRRRVPEWPTLRLTDLSVRPGRVAAVGENCGCVMKSPGDKSPGRKSGDKSPHSKLPPRFRSRRRLIRKIICGYELHRLGLARLETYGGAGRNVEALAAGLATVTVTVTSFEPSGKAPSICTS